MTLDNLVTERNAPLSRRKYCDGGRERHLTEAAVMLAFAMHLFEMTPSLRRVGVYPDGEHGKQFPIRNWLESRGFHRVSTHGTTTYGGNYVRGENKVEVTVKPGHCDVVAKLSDETIVAECKGGIINTRHPGQCSRLRRGLCEAVGLLLVRDAAERQFAVVPDTRDTRALAQRMILRARAAGIEIALVDPQGRVMTVSV